MDGGSSCDLISTKLVKLLGGIEIYVSQKMFSYANGSRGSAISRLLNLSIIISVKNISIDPYILDHGDFPLFLGRKTLSKLQLSIDWYNNTWSIMVDGIKKPLEISNDTEVFWDFLKTQNSLKEYGSDEETVSDLDTNSYTSKESSAEEFFI